MTLTSPQRIADFNADREPERLAMKYAAMRDNPFVFLRGTCHLFHERMSEQGLTPEGPLTWLCGDLHLENFGTFLGANGLTYFDINDFDECVCAPFGCDILRLATSVIVAAPVLKVKPASVVALAQSLIDTYLAELATGKARWIERRTAEGLIGSLIESLKKRDTARLLDKRTEMRGRKRVLKIDGDKMLEAVGEDHDGVREFFERTFAKAPNAKAMTFIDVARRIAGTGSLGSPRFVVLVEGAGSPDGNWLVDLKSTPISSVARHVGVPQPPFPDEAHRVVAIQALLQANTPDLLSAHQFRGHPYVLRQLQPSADRLDLKAAAGDVAGFGAVLETMGRLTAWAHLRGSGRYGADTADELMAVARAPKLAVDLLTRAKALAQINTADWQAYCAAFDAGWFKSK
jgi:uncharacterized protein (DUF2252 family)